MRLPVSRHWNSLRVGTFVVMLLMPASTRAAEWQIRPFAGLTFKGGTTPVDPESAVGKANIVLGVGVALLGEIVGVEGELAQAPGFFQSGDMHLVASSRVTTFSGNVIIGPPRRA